MPSTSTEASHPPRTARTSAAEPSAVERFIAIWRSRRVLRLLVQRDLTVKYQQSFLGYLWSLIEPLAIAGTYWFVFGVLYRKETGVEHVPYILFLASGLFAWMWVAAVLGEATVALTSQARLITTIKVPREVFPIGRVAGKFFEYLAALPVIGVIVLATRHPVDWHLLLLPLAVLIQAVFLVGLALLLSSLNVMLRDVERSMRLAQRVLFYLCPIIYPIGKIHELPRWAKDLYLADPLVGIIQLHHAAIIPSMSPSPRLLFAAVLGSLTMFGAGWWVFYRLEPAVLKEL